MTRSDTDPITAQRKPSVVAIVPALNAAKTLPACLAALKAMKRPPDDIILFNDGSTDATETIARAAGAKVINHVGPPLGPAHGRNAAAAMAGSNLLLFVDADVVVHVDALDELISALQRHSAQAAFGSYDDHPASQRAASLYANLRHHYVHQGSEGEAATFWSGLGLVDRSAFWSVGGFDVPRFPQPSMEDVDLGVRLAATGARMRLVPSAQAKHLKDWTLLQVWRTDVLQRAWPWACLIADRRTVVGPLNLSRGERVKAAVACASALLLAASVAAPWLSLAAGGFLLAYVVLNLDFFALLSKRLRPAGLIQAVFMHWCYHLYSTATYVTAICATRLGLRRASPPIGQIPAVAGDGLGASTPRDRPCAG